MGLLSLFSKPNPTLRFLPSGSMTLDRNGQVLATTISSACPPEIVQEIGSLVLRLFNDARKAQMPLSAVTLRFASLQITARELRGGAILFLTPKHSFTPAPET
ncbi:MAG TPA: hypothetical protein VG733_19010 [Chthoniobacteraceae bacterium]|nr:hypothetical protein [Verrucomicrobiae bacterium]HWB61581.1 hypothetical protein [Chthoniobacteraceae bacterium]